MSNNIKDHFDKIGELSEQNNNRIKEEYAQRATSIGRVIAEDVLKNKYQVFIYDEKVTVKALLSDSINNQNAKAKIKVGQRVLVAHKKGLDCIILSILDPRRDNDISADENTKDNGLLHRLASAFGINIW